MNHDAGRRGIVATSISLAILFTLPTGASLHCNGEITAVIVAGKGIYIDDRSEGPGDIQYWPYLESNGQPGLQSGGSPIAPTCEKLFCFTDPCWHHDPDTLIV